MPNRSAIIIRSVKIADSIPKAGLKSWHRSDLGITLNGSTVSSWADQSGNGFNLDQGTGSKQPLFESGALNGLPVITLDGVDDYLRCASFTCAIPYSKFIVVKIISWTGYDFIYNGGGLINSVNMLFPSPTVSMASGGAYSNESLSFGLGAFALLATKMAGSSGSYLQKNNDAKTDVTGIGNGSDSAFNLGIYSNLFSYAGNISVAEIIQYDRVLSDGEDLQVKKWLNSRYNLY